MKLAQDMPALETVLSYVTMWLVKSGRRDRNVSKGSAQRWVCLDSVSCIRPEIGCGFELRFHVFRIRKCWMTALASSKSRWLCPSEIYVIQDIESQIARRYHTVLSGCIVFLSVPLRSHTGGMHQIQWHWLWVQKWAGDLQIHTHPPSRGAWEGGHGAPGEVVEGI